MAVYYVDSAASANGDGLSESSPVRNYRTLAVKPGDTVLIKAGSVFRDCLDSPNGEEGNVITWDMYGQGEKPRFLGSVNLHDETAWRETAPNIWAWQGDFSTQVCNLIFDGGRECGVLAWEYEDLNAQGKWHYTHMGYNDDNLPEKLHGTPKVLYLYSVGNPGKVYSDIECAVYGHRCLLRGQKHIRFRHIACLYSGVHAYGQSFVEDIVIENCEFRFIGGCVWDRVQRIRFGNGVEIWEHGKDFTLRNCYFDEVYDSCTTHQGFKNENPCERINIVGNVFRHYGMAAYELRDRIALDTHFDNNLCIGAGLGFSLQGETPPRKSELWPQPMGHHLFIWRIPFPTENGCITVHNNIFHEAPYGAAVYSTIDERAEKQLDFADNVYYETKDTYLIRLGGKNYGKADFETYRRERGTDNGSRVEDLLS